MRKTLLCTLPLILGLGATARAQSEQQPSPPLPRSEDQLVDTLDQANLQEAIRILLKSYIKRDGLDSLELNRAALQGLLDRTGFGVTLVDRKNESENGHDPHKLVAETLTKTVAYLRPGTFSAEEISTLGDHLTRLEKEGAQTLIIDLRSPAREASFQDAARFLNHFCPPNELLFKIQKPGQDRPALFLSKPATGWSRDLILLIDEQTPPAAEAIGTVLGRLHDPLIVGAATPGRTVEYEKVIIGDDAYMRFAVAEVIFPDDLSIFRKGIQPDLEATLSPDDKHAIFNGSQEQGMKSYIFSKQQPRHNEAALVAGTNPELDYAIAKSAGRDTGYDTIPKQDRVVQAALDYLVTTSFLKLEEH